MADLTDLARSPLPLGGGVVHRRFQMSLSDMERVVKIIVDDISGMKED